MGDDRQAQWQLVDLMHRPGLGSSVCQWWNRRLYCGLTQQMSLKRRPDVSEQSSINMVHSFTGFRYLQNYSPPFSYPRSIFSQAISASFLLVHSLWSKPSLFSVHSYLHFRHVPSTLLQDGEFLWENCEILNCTLKEHVLWQSPLLPPLCSLFGDCLCRSCLIKLWCQAMPPLHNSLPRLASNKLYTFSTFH